MFTYFNTTSYIICFIWCLRSGIIPENETFLWLTLANPDPFLYTTNLKWVSTYAQQKIMGNNDNPPKSQKYDDYYAF